MGVDRLSFLQKVPGLVVPDHLIERVRQSGDAEEESYRQGLPQCVQERDGAQRDACIDNAIGQHQPNS